MKKGVLLAIFILAASIVSGQDLYSEIADSDEHTIFLDLLEFTGLDSLLLNDDYYSVLAPNNEAFESKYDAAAIDSLKVNDPAFLESLLLNHFVADTVYVEFGATFLPLRGSHCFLFIDASGNVLVLSLGTPTGEPYIYLSGTAGSTNNYTDFDNGRLFWVEQNFIHPNCRTIDEWYEVIGGNLANVLIQAGWIDTLLTITTPITFLSPPYEIYQHIDDNGGYNNAPFVDSLIRRHIINEYVILQNVEEGTIVQNLLGEDLHLSKQDSLYFLDDSIEILSYTDYKKLATLAVDSLLLEPVIIIEPIEPAKSAERIEPITSTTEGIHPEHFTIFPNPASEVVTITHSGSSDRSTVSIYTIDGKFIFKRDYSGAEFEIDVSTLNPGLYILEFQNNFHRKRTKLLVF